MIGPDFIKHNKNKKELTAILRSKDVSSDLRAMAAEQLGSLMDYSVSETLICSFLMDPDSKVAEAAQNALELLLADRAQMAVESYTPDFDTWLLDIEELQQEYEYDLHEDFFLQLSGQNNSGFEISDGEFNKLVRIVNSNAPVEKQVRAIRLMKNCNNFHMVDVLLRLAVDGYDERIRVAAQEEIFKLFPEQGAEMIKNYQDEQFPVDINNEPEELEYPIIEDEIESVGNSSVIQKDRPNLLPIVIAAVAIIIFYLIYHFLS